MQKVAAGFRVFDVDSIDALERSASVVFPPGGFPPRGTSPERRAASLAGRAVLALLFQKIGFKGHVRPIQPFGYLAVFDAGGKPAPFFANLSHTQGAAVAVISPMPVGIDIERLDRSADRVLRRVSTDAELAYVSGKKWGALPLPIALWSAKEAVSKAVGLGIKFGMNAFEVDFATPAPHRVTCREKGPLFVRQPAVDCQVIESWVVSICTERDVLEQKVEWL